MSNTSIISFLDESANLSRDFQKQRQKHLSHRSPPTGVMK